MAAGGFKEFVAGETLDEDDINDFLMQGMLVFAGTAARGSAMTAPVEGQFTYLADSDTVEFFDGSQFVPLASGVGAAVVSATTGSPTITSGTSIGGTAYDIYEFTGDGSITIDEAGLADVLVIGGGGPGGNDEANGAAAGAGGGAGGYIESASFYVPVGSYTISIGAGGVGTADVRANELGSGSAFGSILAAPGGGPGGGWVTGNGAVAGKSGGSGGGGILSSGAFVGPAGQTIFGNSGGDGTGLSGASGGGGGAGADGSNASGTVGGAGGAGQASSITGSSVTRAGGGGGGGNTGGAGGTGGGGAGGLSGGTAGSANTGGGGGGSGTPTLGGTGGSGIVIVRVAV